jgi:hypothetical protein
MKADRGILVLPLTDDITIAAELLGWFERETFEENWYLRAKGGNAHPDSRWLKSSYLIKPYVLLIEPCDGGTYAAINEQYQSRVKSLPKAEQAEWHEDNVRRCMGCACPVEPDGFTSSERPIKHDRPCPCPCHVERAVPK